MTAPLLPALPGYDNPELIAHGTTALVFRAIQTTLNRPVAIKVITVDTGSAVPVNAARELATTVALSSQPHIVSIIDTGVTEDDRPYIVMEYCEGGSYAADPAPARPAAASTTCSRSASRSVRRCTPPTRPASCTATSSRPTSCARGSARR